MKNRVVFGGSAVIALIIGISAAAAAGGSGGSGGTGGASGSAGSAGGAASTAGSGTAGAAANGAATGANNATNSSTSPGAATTGAANTPTATPTGGINTGNGLNGAGTGTPSIASKGVAGAMDPAVPSSGGGDRSLTTGRSVAGSSRTDINGAPPGDDLSVTDLNRTLRGVVATTDPTGGHCSRAGGGCPDETRPK